MANALTRSTRLRKLIKPVIALVLLNGLVGCLGSGSSAVQTRLSKGDRVLIENKNVEAKKIATRAIESNNLDIATQTLESMLKTDRNDPEALIYLNNVKAKKFSDTNFNIGVIVPIGTNINVAQEMLRGVAQAQDEFNQAGGIAGKRIVVTIADDRNDPKIATEIAQEFVKPEHGLLAVVGSNASDPTLASAPIYQDNKLVMMSPTSTSNKLSGFGPYIFRTVPGSRVFADLLSEYVTNTIKKDSAKKQARIGICQDTRAIDNMSFRDDFIASFVGDGGQIVPLDCELSVPNFNAADIIRRAQAEQINMLLVAPHIDHLEVAVRLAVENRGRLPLVSSQTMYAAKVLEGGDAMKGLVIPVFWHKNLNPTFSKTAVNYWSGNVNWRTATTYDATKAVIKAISSSPSDPTRESIQQTLRSGNFSVEGSTGELRFIDTGDRIGKPVLMTVKPMAKGYEFVPLETSADSGTSEKPNEKPVESDTIESHSRLKS